MARNFGKNVYKISFDKSPDKKRAYELFEELALQANHAWIPVTLMVATNHMLVTERQKEWLVMVAKTKEIPMTIEHITKNGLEQ
jgi:hypothetical protein